MKFYNEFNGILYKNSYPSKSSSVSVTAISPWNLEQTLKVTKGMIILMQAYYPDFHDYLHNSNQNLCLILEQLLEKWLSLGRVPTCPGESRSRWTPSPTPQKMIDSIWNEYCEWRRMRRWKAWYSFSSISELISQSLPFQGKRFPARFDLGW